MFQSFPLGDRSSVNLRGEYHVENITTFEELPTRPASDPEEGMQTDQEFEHVNAIKNAIVPIAGATEDTDMAESSKIGQAGKSVVFEGDSGHNRTQPDMDALYPVFWSLQASFSNPTRLFDEASFQDFKTGLGLTMDKLQSIHQESQGRGSSKLVDESPRGMKRKRGDEGDDLATSFNPKYLTSRDLFELEVGVSGRE